MWLDDFAEQVGLRLVANEMWESFTQQAYFLKGSLCVSSPEK
jgi:hypothetical protein